MLQNSMIEFGPVLYLDGSLCTLNYCTCSVAVTINVDRFAEREREREIRIQGSGTAK